MLVKAIEYSSDDSINFQYERLFWENEGYHVRVSFRGPVWVIYVMEGD